MMNYCIISTVNLFELNILNSAPYENIYRENQTLLAFLD